MDASADGRFHVAFLRSDGRMPAHAAILHEGTTQRALAPQTMPADLPVTQLVEPQAVTFHRRRWHADSRAAVRARAISKVASGGQP